MKLTLNFDRMKRHWFLTATELAGDEGFQPHDGQTINWEGERVRFNTAVRSIRDQTDNLRYALFNQWLWPGTSGWEYWKDDEEAILAHALAVAERLGCELEIE